MATRRMSRDMQMAVQSGMSPEAALVQSIANNPDAFSDNPSRMLSALRSGQEGESPDLGSVIPIKAPGGKLLGYGIRRSKGALHFEGLKTTNDSSRAGILGREAGLITRIIQGKTAEGSAGNTPERKQYYQEKGARLESILGELGRMGVSAPEEGEASPVAAPPPPQGAGPQSRFVGKTLIRDKVTGTKQYYRGDPADVPRDKYDILQ